MHFITWLTKLSLTLFTVIVTVFLAVLFIVILITAITFNREAEPYATVYGEEDAPILAEVPISGVILGEESLSDITQLLGEGVTYGYTIQKELKEFETDDDIEGLFITIDSPGGTIYGSRAISRAIEDYKKNTGKPVYVYIAGMAASGGYWSAIAGDKVIADYGSAIGSIGVISGPFQYYDTVTAIDGGLLSGGVVTQNGIETFYISAGQSKDIGNPFRRMTEQEIATLQQGVNMEYGTFIADVSRLRNIPPDTLTASVGAMIYSNVQAERLKLIDDSMGKSQAYSELARAAGIGDNFRVVKKHNEVGFMQALLSSYFPQKSSIDSTSATAYICAKPGVLALHTSIATLCIK